MIVVKANIDKLPRNCSECNQVNCSLPLKRTKTCITDEIKKDFIKKRHPDCPLIEIEGLG